jgi:short subunit dehydrogenase-like uncharacterized protein
VRAVTRPYDLVLFGATGFTGALVAEYLARRPTPADAPRLRWALAGRNRTKLEKVRADLAVVDPALVDLPLLEADAADVRSLVAVAEQAELVVTTVGPYMVHGLPLAEACADAGTDYCDLTGETPFVRSVIDRCHARAAETGARLVPCSGFDSIPSDLGVFLLHEHFARRGERLGRARFLMGTAKGAFSGGTAASMVNLMESATRDRAVRRVLGDPYALSPDPSKDRGPDGGDPRGIGHDDDARTWTAPFVMAAINTRVVRRTNALLDFPYGRDFRYEEVMGTGDGPAGLLRAATVTAGMGAVLALAATTPTRRVLQRFLPKSGEGPSRRDRETGFFKVRILGWAAGQPRPSAVCHVEGTNDPGYGETAKMLGESALLMLETRTATEGKRGGVWTPASAFGSALAERLRAAGMRWDVEPL